MKVRETVDRLMRLALADIPDSDTARKNEARNAAVQALKLIEEHKLLDLGPEKTKLPFELAGFDVNMLFQKLYTMDFAGAVAMIQRLQRRTERISRERMGNIERDFRDEPTWTEKVTHHARRANQTMSCSLCGEPVLMLMWIANPFRQNVIVHLRCFREIKEKAGG